LDQNDIGAFSQKVFRIRFGKRNSSHSASFIGRPSVDDRLLSAVGSAALRHTIAPDIVKHVRQNVNALILFAPCVELSKVYIRIVVACADLKPRGRGRENYVTNRFSVWLSNSLADRDCYFMSDLIFDWCDPLHRADGLRTVVYLFGTQFADQMRFFPVLVGVFKFFKSRFRRQLPAQMAECRAELEVVGGAMMCRAHGGNHQAVLGRGKLITGFIGR
jgi:hypothetical protein